MTLSKGRLIAARYGLNLEQALCGGLVEEQQRPPPGDSEMFQVSVQFALAHGVVQGAAPRSEITTLRSSTLLSGACSR